jgi:hypothetical protein
MKSGQNGLKSEIGECLDLESNEHCLFVEGKVLKWKKDDDPLSLDLIRFGPGLPDFS